MVIGTIDEVSCKECNKVFKNKRAFAGHMWIVHRVRVGKLWNKEQELLRLQEEAKKAIAGCEAKQKKMSVDYEALQKKLIAEYEAKPPIIKTIEKLVEKPVQKIVYKDKLVDANCPVCNKPISEHSKTGDGFFTKRGLICPSD